MRKASSSNALLAAAAGVPPSRPQSHEHLAPLHGGSGSPSVATATAHARGLSSSSSVEGGAGEQYGGMEPVEAAIPGFPRGGPALPSGRLSSPGPQHYQQVRGGGAPKPLTLTLILNY